MKPVRKRKLIDEMRGDWAVSIRRACRVFLFDTSTYHYKSRRPGQAPLEHRIKEICQTRVRYGYRRVHIVLRRDGWRVNQKKTRRTSKVCNCATKTPKRRMKAKLWEDRCPAVRPNETWAMDFVHDQLATGRKLRVLTIVDTFSRNVRPHRTTGRRSLSRIVWSGRQERLGLCGDAARLFDART